MNLIQTHITPFIKAGWRWRMNRTDLCDQYLPATLTFGDYDEFEVTHSF